MFSGQKFLKAQSVLLLGILNYGGSGSGGGSGGGSCSCSGGHSGRGSGGGSGRGSVCDSWCANIIILDFGVGDIDKHTSLLRWVITYLANLI